MIFTRYQDFRAGFALVAAATDVDGFPVFPYAKLRTGGFDGTITFDDPHTVNLYSTVMNITCNAYAADASPGVDEFDWYISQRSDTIASQYFAVSAYASNRSGSIKLTATTANTALLLPTQSAPPIQDYRSDDAIRLLFKDVAIYVQRRSDKAYQWFGNRTVG